MRNFVKLLPVILYIRIFDLRPFAFAVAAPTRNTLLSQFISPIPEDKIILLVDVPLILKFPSVNAPISPTVTSVSFNVIPPRLKEIQFEFVIILFCPKFVFPVLEPVCKYIPSNFSFLTTNCLLFTFSVPKNQSRLLVVVLQPYI